MSHNNYLAEGLFMKIVKIILPFLFFTFQLSAESPTEKIPLIERYLTKATENGYSGSVLIALGGNVLLKKGYGLADSKNNLPFTADTIFDIGSITKQFTAACILKLEMQGKLSVQDQIKKYFDNVPAVKQEITIHNLLTHSAGLIDSLGEDEELIGREEYLKKAFDSKLLHKPGTFDYSNVGYSVLAAIVEKVSGQEYEHFLYEQILKPAGMEHTGYVLPKWDHKQMAIGYSNNEEWGTTFDQSQYLKGVTWHLKGNGGIHSTVGDLYLWSQALQGNAILSEEAKKKYFAPQVPVGDEKHFYGYGWLTSETERKEKLIGHNGGNGYFMDTMAMIPQKNYVVIVSTNRNPKNSDVIATRIDRLLFGDLKELDEAFIKKYTGKYKLPSGTVVPISFNENDEAVLVLNTTETWKIFGSSDADVPEQIEEFNQKSAKLLQAMKDQNVVAATSLSGLSKEEVESFLPQFKKRVEGKVGAWKNSQVIGTVGRRKGAYHLTPIRISGENKEMFRLLIWRGDHVVEFRPLPDGNTKSFEHIKESEFNSESNNRTIRLTEDDKGPKLVLVTASGEVTARRSN
jgi:CubicO group peptidase (beta-lactamase class C family)